MKAEWFKRWDDEEEIEDYWAATREEEDEEESKPVRNSWWSTFHGSSKKKAYTPVKSTSAYLRSSTSTWWKSKSNARDNRQDLLEVLKEVNKTINLTQNSSDGNEQSITVRYGNNGVRNDLLSDNFYISSEVICDSNGVVLDKEDDAYYDGLDALNGQAMLCSFMKKNVSPRAANQYTISTNWACRNIYMTDLQTTAGNEIYSEWPGFQSYIDQQQKIFQLSKEEVLAPFFQSNGQTNIDDFINLLCYNRLSKDRVVYRDVFDENIAQRLESADHYFNSTLDEEYHNDARFERASDIFSKVQRMLDLQEPPPPPPDDSDEESDEDSDSSSGEGGSSGDSDDESNEENSGDASGEGSSEGDDDSNDADGESNSSSKAKVDSIDTNSNSSKDRRYTGDNSFNSSYDNEDGSDIDPNEKLRDQQKREDDKLSQIQDSILEDAEYKKVIPAVNDCERTEYKNFVAKSRNLINTIKDCFQFHNSECGIYSHGLTAGSVDENNLFKVHMGEYDRLYERQDILAKKKWLVSILIDQSGSMDDCTRGGKTRMQTTRELAIVFSEALKSLKDLDFSVYGFSTLYNRIDTIVYKDKEVNKLEALIEAFSQEGTGMGFHIAHVGDRMLRQYGEYENKILFVITDGEPNAYANHYMSGIEHTNKCVNMLRKRGIHVYGIGIDNAFDNSRGESLFGKGNFVVIDNVKNTLKILVNRLRNFLQRMKK